MMRITNSMMVKKTKTNINTNRARVDYTNNQMALQKKIVKPSDNPIIAIRALRLRSTLSTITQYYERNIPDTEAWMDCTGTALNNVKSMLKEGYDQVVYGSTDSLNTENRQAVLKSLQHLQQQIYSEGNADYAGRTVFTGYKTNQTLTFTNTADAKAAHYQIEERFTYKDIDKKNYYSGTFDRSDVPIPTPGNTVNAELFEQHELNRLRLSYDNITPGDDVNTTLNEGNSLTISYPYPADPQQSVDVTMGTDGTVNICGIKFTPQFNPAGTNPPTQPSATVNIDQGNASEYYVHQSPTNTYSVYRISDMDTDANGTITGPNPSAVKLGSVTLVEENSNGNLTGCHLTTDIGGNNMTYRVTDTASLEADKYALSDNEIVFNAESGELIFNDNVANMLEKNTASFKFTYDKNGFEEGELHPENYFNCTKYVKDSDPIVYDNYDENGKWKTEAIYYNIAGGQQMQINTEARDVFDSNIRRDMDDLIDIVQTAISAQETVDSIEAKIKEGNYATNSDEYKQLSSWLDAAKKQRDYANQNMHDTYSAYITKFQGYMDKASLADTDLGGRGERVELTKHRMSVQQSTFEELKSSNEDMELSDLVINYSAASVAYQAALQASAKIGQMTLLNFI